MERPQLLQLLAVLPKVGRDFVAYASDTTPETISSMANGDETISISVAQAANELHTLINHHMPTSDSAPGVGIDVNAHLDMLNMSALMGSQYEGNSIANAVRLVIGATLPSLNTNDALEAELVKLSVDIYPLLLLPQDTDDKMPNFFSISSMVSPSIHRNGYADFFSALEVDEVLGRLHVHSAGEEKLLKSMYYSLNTGSGSHQQMFSLPMELAQNAYYKCKIEGNISVEAFLAEVIEHLRMFKQLVGGGTVTIKAYVGINGVILPQGIKMELPWGTLRTPTDTEKELLSHRAQLINSTLEVPFKLRLKRHRSFTAPYPFMKDMQRENVEDAAMLTAATIMVALGKEIRAENVGTIIIPVVGYAPSVSWPFEKHGVVQTNLSARDRTKVLRLAKVIDSHKKYLNIALRRNLLAIGRIDTLDGFIDSVTATESLFGSKKETTFTVSAAMAKFLETTIEKRRLLQKEIANDLYDKRSRIVHGSEFPSARVVEPKRQRVIDLNILALRKLLRGNKDLIDCSSSERSAKILLS
jgi:hypothetical protein